MDGLGGRGGRLDDCDVDGLGGRGGSPVAFLGDSIVVTAVVAFVVLVVVVLAVILAVEMDGLGGSGAKC